jgi:uncharacterized membrane protein YesL
MKAAALSSTSSSERVGASGRGTAQGAAAWVSERVRLALLRLATLIGAASLLLQLAGTPTPSRVLGLIGMPLPVVVAVVAFFELRRIPVDWRPLIWRAIRITPALRITRVCVLLSVLVVLAWSVSVRFTTPGLYPLVGSTCCAAVGLASGAVAGRARTDARREGG